ncbi:hypothetical protein J2X72_003914 [Phyllobacterium sp. 1468]|nr:hypothetical protein [Phyllobacterium sp. 1468]
MAIEKAQAKRGNAPRKILVRGKPLDIRLNSDPVAIARSMRRESPAAKREARLQALERKHGLR